MFLNPPIVCSDNNPRILSIHDYNLLNYIQDFMRIR